MLLRSLWPPCTTTCSSPTTSVSSTQLAALSREVFLFRISEVRLLAFDCDFAFSEWLEERSAVCNQLLAVWPQWWSHEEQRGVLQVPQKQVGADRWGFPPQISEWCSDMFTEYAHTWLMHLSLGKHIVDLFKKLVLFIYFFVMMMMTSPWRTYFTFLDACLLAFLPKSCWKDLFANMKPSRAQVCALQGICVLIDFHRCPWVNPGSFHPVSSV